MFPMLWIYITGNLNLNKTDLNLNVLRNLLYSFII